MGLVCFESSGEEHVSFHMGLGDDLDYGGACVLAGFSLLPFICIIAASLLS